MKAPFGISKFWLWSGGVLAALVVLTFCAAWYNITHPTGLAQLIVAVWFAMLVRAVSIAWIACFGLYLVFVRPWTKTRGEN